MLGKEDTKSKVRSGSCPEKGKKKPHLIKKKLETAIVCCVKCSQFRN